MKKIMQNMKGLHEIDTENNPELFNNEEMIQINREKHLDMQNKQE